MPTTFVRPDIAGLTVSVLIIFGVEADVIVGLSCGRSKHLIVTLKFFWSYSTQSTVGSRHSGHHISVVAATLDSYISQAVMFIHSYI